MGSAWIIGLWVVSTVVLILMGLGHIFSNNLPKFCHDIILYGKLKTQNNGGSLIRYLDVPKSWFKYLYIFSTFFNAYTAISFSNSVWQKSDYPPFLSSLVNTLETSRTITTDRVTASVIIWMIVFHSIRRAYECIFVSIFSIGKISLFLFVEGLLLYASLAISVIIEAPRPTDDVTHLTAARFGSRHVTGLIVYAFASYNQYDTHKRFASFRQNKQGVTVSHDHVIPHGGYFEYVSCPNYLMEIMEYISYLIIIGTGNHTFLSNFFFVVLNQLTLSLIAHKWYIEHFQGKYPTNRKAVIPFIL